MKRKNFKIVEALLNKNLRQADLVSLAGLTSEARLSRIINHLVHPTDAEVMRICEILSLNSDDVKGCKR